jgi:hypothetical protein
MNVHADDRPTPVLLTSAQLELIRVAIRHLLASEDDPATIDELKRLLEQLSRPAEAG